jgi:hypothetical protein
MRQVNQALLQTILAAWMFSIAAFAADAPIERNGDWLMAGIRVFDRIQSGQGTVTSEDANQVNLVFGYIRGVLDVQHTNVLKALVAQGVIQQARKEHAKINPAVLEEQDKAANWYAPLWHSEFFTTEMTADRMMGIVRVYLEKHPEKWAKHADELIEAVFLDALSPKPESAQH